MLQKDSWSNEINDTWGRRLSATKEIKHLEKPLEQAVSLYVRKMPFLWLEVNDSPELKNLRGIIESNSIALLSNYNSVDDPIDPPSSTWLGRWAKSEEVSKSGLWNSNHVMHMILAF